MPFCLIKEKADKLKKAIKDGTLNPEKLRQMSSLERRNFLGTIIGKEAAKETNILFEKKLLLKNQERAMYDWARQITGLNKEDKEATIAKIKATYAEKKRRLLDPKENEIFLADLAAEVYSKKYKADVSVKEAQKITELAQDVKEAKDEMNDDFTWKNDRDGINYGAKKVAYDNYVNALNEDAKKLGWIDPRVDLRRSIGRALNISFNTIADNTRAFKASFDNSLWGRQGIKALYRPATTKIWAKNFAKSFNDIYNVLWYGNKKGDAILDSVKAEIYSRKNYLNGLYGKGRKLNIGIKEEETPTSLPAKIPVLGRAFKAAEVAYEAGATRLRADIADKIYEIAEKAGVDMESKEEVGAINDMVNSMTGRGYMGRLEGKPSELTNKAFFSIKFFKANIDTLIKPATAKTKFARKQAGMNLLSMIVGIGLISMIADSFDDDSVEWDSRSAGFGKIKLGKTKFDITGGIGSLLILASRIARQSSKSSTTDLVTEFNSGFGSPTGMSVFWDFTEGKFSPIASIIKEYVDQRTFEGDKPTLLKTARESVTPILFSTTADAYKIDSQANALMALIADALGISAGTYESNTKWENSDSKELTEHKEKVGEEQFMEDNKEFNEKVNKLIDELKTDTEYQSMSNNDKKKYLTNEKRKIKQKIIK